ncbi:MAG: hypothetical protein AAGK93_03830, partial [Pseudomonadota bacterium]
GEHAGRQWRDRATYAYALLLVPASLFHPCRLGIHDRAIGGPRVPRPSQELIERNTGPLKSSEEIERQAKGFAERQQSRHEAKKENREKVNESIKLHEEAMKAREVEKTKSERVIEKEKSRPMQRPARDDFKKADQERVQDMARDRTQNRAREDFQRSR